MIIELRSPVPGWLVSRQRGIELFTSPDGVVYIRGSFNKCDVIVSFVEELGLPPLYLRRLNDISRQRLQWLCPRHKLYQAKRKPRTNCAECWDAYNSKADKAQQSVGSEEQGTGEVVPTAVSTEE